MTTRGTKLTSSPNMPFDFARRDFSLAPATLYRVGGPARLALFPRTRQEVQAAYEWMLEQPLPRLVLGGGSNVLISDEGFPGIVLFTVELRELTALGDDRYYIGAGVVLDDVVRGPMLERNYEGVGGLTGIPGTVGGAIFMNAGTVNGSTCQWMTSVDVLKADGLHEIPMTPDLYNYRGQRFCAPGEVILGGHFQFHPAATPQRPIYDHYKQRRLEKQPQGYCCGSVFKNPEGDHAGRLIEACGLKGTRHGGAVISPLHANFIMNEHNASFKDILFLIQHTKEAVRNEFGINLEEEVRIIAPAGILSLDAAGK
ncbi:MAG: UDP-N-acetylmuramate dehydrogenase [Candidatus Hydrogenedentes bacterium]|nr:UDP-N-acetylmuramate dehydrogenase [Candidatus Hydrogenedentota bacterium]MBI3117817.1 UDP-N-acetylmuramate dehydrogenase [Candidatus Hydrogenedentota bacterium]